MHAIGAVFYNPSGFYKIAVTIHVGPTYFDIYNGGF